ncbi:MAG: MBL fold metallo-hydrolase [Candidatus Micrarchaeaceae archaeon]|jgi:putative mRNA 3-end processing factor
MMLKFFGGAQEVGRSAILLKDDTTLLLDYGIKLNHGIEYPTEVTKTDAFVLSHAHLDHCGFAPTLYNEMLIPSFGTEPTLELSELLLNDALNIAKKEHKQQRYHKKQIATFMHRYTSLEYGNGAMLGNFNIEMYDAGHICGSAITLIERKNAKDNKRVVYTGDFKLEPQFLHKGAEIVKGDILIMESTYATREHPDRNETMKKLVESIKETLDNKGNVLLPVFAVGRSQELLTLLYKNNLTQYAYLDGMARTATSIVLRNSNFIDNAASLEKAVSETTLIKSQEDRFDALNGPSIIMTTAGMLTGGPVLEYITKLKNNSKIFLTGYQVEGSNGRTLLEKGFVTLKEKPVKIPTPTEFYDMSAHAGKKDLHEYVKRSSPGKVICVHGDKDNSIELAESLKLEGYEAYAPKLGETLKFD